MQQRSLAVPRMWGRGFTLIELVIAVAIIGILVAIIMPSVGRARELARTTQCAANMRTIGGAAVAYSAKNNRVLLPCRIATPMGSGNYQYWANLLVDGKYLPGAPRMTPADHKNNAPPMTSGPLYCPSGSMELLPPNFDGNTASPSSRVDEVGSNCARLPLPSNSPNGSPISGLFVDAWYGMNADRGSGIVSGTPGRCLEETSDVAVRTSNVTNASSMVLMYDGVYYHQQSVNANRVNARHMKKTQTNLLFVDGHVETWLTRELPGGLNAQVTDFSLANLAAQTTAKELRWWLEQP